jgi:hypothetical protein
MVKRILRVKINLIFFGLTLEITNQSEKEDEGAVGELDISFQEGYPTLFHTLFSYKKGEKMRDISKCLHPKKRVQRQD